MTCTILRTDRRLDGRIPGTGEEVYSYFTYVKFDFNDESRVGIVHWSPDTDAHISVFPTSCFPAETYNNYPDEHTCVFGERVFLPDNAQSVDQVERFICETVVPRAIALMNEELSA